MEGLKIILSNLSTVSDSFHNCLNISLFFYSSGWHSSCRHQANNIHRGEMMKELFIILLLASNVLLADEVVQAQGAESSRQQVKSFISNIDNFSIVKYKRYKKYRGNLFSWLDKYEKNKGNQSFRESFKQNVKFMLNNYKSYLLAEIGSEDQNMNNQILLKRFHKKLLKEKIKNAVKNTEGVHAAVQGSDDDSAVGQVFGNREDFTAKLDEAFLGNLSSPCIDDPTTTGCDVVDDSVSSSR
jgi:hypothetical protein